MKFLFGIISDIFILTHYFLYFVYCRIMKIFEKAPGPSQNFNASASGEQR